MTLAKHGCHGAGKLHVGVGCAAQSLWHVPTCHARPAAPLRCPGQKMDPYALVAWGTQKHRTLTHNGELSRRRVGAAAPQQG